MPTYEYVCESCNNHWEEVQKITAPAVEEWPQCHNKTAKRQISGGRFILKGGGWYADLYSSSSKPKASKEESSESKSEKKTESTSTEAKSTSSDSSGGSSSGSGSTPATSSPSTAPAKS